MSLKKIKAGSLLFALTIALVVAMICSALILVNHYNQLFYYQNTYHNIINQTESQFDKLVSQNNVTIEDVSEKHTRKKNNWGLYDVVLSKEEDQQKNWSKAAIISYTSQPKTGLYLVEQNQALKVCGNTRLEGISYIPKAGIERSYIEGKTYQNKKLIYGSKQLSKKQLPSLSTTHQLKITYLQHYLQRPGELLEEDAYSHSFDTTSLHFHFDRTKRIQHLSLKGNIILSCSGKLIVGSTCELDNIIIVAQEIEIEAGFTGNVQLFAVKQLLLHDHVTLKSPSGIVLMEQQNDTISNEITIGKNCEIHSHIINLALHSRKQPTTTTIDKGTIVNGVVYTNGRTDCKGTINGSLYTKELFLKTKSAVYTNHLLDVKISPLGLPSYIPTLDLFDEEKKIDILDWVE